MSRKTLKFLHIPKTGGTSIEEAAHDAGLNWGAHDPHLNLESYNSLGTTYHQPLHQMTDRSAYEYLIENFDFFCVVRNPYEKCVSEFYCPWESGAPVKDTTQDYFNMFIQKRIQEGWTSDHWSPQSRFVFDSDGKQIIKHVLRYENLAKEFKELSRIIWFADCSEAPYK